MAITWTIAGTDNSASDAQLPWVEVEENVFAHFGGSSTAVVATYNPGTEDFTFTSAASPPWYPDTGYFAGVSRLADGRVFVSGGSSGLVETYIGTFATNDFTWVTSTPLPAAGITHAQVVLPDGRLFVLLMSAPFDGVAQLGSVSGDTVSWASATGAPLDEPAKSYGACATVLPDGRVLVVFGAYEMAFATVSGGAVTWEAASVSGGTYNTDAAYVSVEVRWDGSVLLGGGYDGIGSYTYPEEYMNTVAWGEISGTTVTLTDFDPLPTAHPEVGVRFFLLSDDKVLAACTNLDTGDDELSLGEDTDPPVGTPYPAALAVSAGSSAAFGGAAIAYVYTTWAAGSSTVEWTTDDRSPLIEGGSVAAFHAPSYAVLNVVGGSSASFQMSRKVPFALYWGGKAQVSFKAQFEKQTALKAYGGSTAAFKSQPTVPVAMAAAGGSKATFKGGAFATAAVGISAASAAAMKSQVIATAAIAAASSSAAAFLSSVFGGGVLQMYCSSSGAFVGDFGTVALLPEIDAADTLHVFTRQQQLSIEDFA